MSDRSTEFVIRLSIGLMTIGFCAILVAATGLGVKGVRGNDLRFVIIFAAAAVQMTLTAVGVLCLKILQCLQCLTRTKNHEHGRF